MEGIRRTLGSLFVPAGYQKCLVLATFDDTEATSEADAEVVIQGLLGHERGLSTSDAKALLLRRLRENWTWKCVVKVLLLLHRLLRSPCVTHEWWREHFNDTEVFTLCQAFREGEGTDSQAETHTLLIRKYAKYLEGAYNDMFKKSKHPMLQPLGVYDSSGVHDMSLDDVFLLLKMHALLQRRALSAISAPTPSNLPVDNNSIPLLQVSGFCALSGAIFVACFSDAISIYKAGVPLLKELCSRRLHPADIPAACDTYGLYEDCFTHLQGTIPTLQRILASENCAASSNRAMKSIFEPLPLLPTLSAARQRHQISNDLSTKDQRRSKRVDRQFDASDNSKVERQTLKQSRAPDSPQTRSETRYPNNQDVNNRSDSNRDPRKKHYLKKYRRSSSRSSSDSAFSSDSALNSSSSFTKKSRGRGEKHSAGDRNKNCRRFEEDTRAPRRTEKDPQSLDRISSRMAKAPVNLLDAQEEMTAGTPVISAQPRCESSTRADLLSELLNEEFSELVNVDENQNRRRRKSSMFHVDVVEEENINTRYQRPRTQVSTFSGSCRKNSENYLDHTTANNASFEPLIETVQLSTAENVNTIVSSLPVYPHPSYARTVDPGMVSIVSLLKAVDDNTHEDIGDVTTKRSSSNDENTSPLPANFVSTEHKNVAVVEEHATSLIGPECNVSADLLEVGELLVIESTKRPSEDLLD